jgi:hypothetical protein
MAARRAHACPPPGSNENKEFVIRDKLTEFAMSKPRFK